MGKVLYFPKLDRNEDQAKILRLQSYIRSNIIQLTELRHKLLKLEKGIKGLKRINLRIVENETAKRDGENKD